jgi:integrase
MKVQLKHAKGGWRTRIRCGSAGQRYFTIALDTELAAHERAEALVAMARRLVEAGRDAEAVIILNKGASERDAGRFREIEAFASEMCAKGGSTGERAPALVTFRQLGELWTSGELARRHPDHVRVKRSVETDRQRLAKLYETVGEVPLESFSVEDAERAMRALPNDIEPGTRRHYGQLMSRVLKLAVYPCKLIGQSPLPVGFLPRVKGKKAKSFLYPSEESTLLACGTVPLWHRLLYGFLAREGMRYSEAAHLSWADLDLERGSVTLDVNKSDDPRAWALSPGVAAALEACRPDDAGDDALVFARAMSDSAAELFREHLKLAGVTRAELFRRTASRLPIRVHDLRGTFVTLSLAAGKSESWVADRTGHRSSQMINTYRRAARTASELSLGSLKVLNEALGLSHEVSCDPPGRIRMFNEIMVGHEGLEPSTNGLRIHCSTN